MNLRLLNAFLRSSSIVGTTAPLSGIWKSLFHVEYAAASLPDFHCADLLGKNWIGEIES
jgi:hypothetical protein